MQIKVCGLTRPADAALAARLGATAVGLVFWPRSPRAVSVEQAEQIVAALPPGVTPVGVFVNADPAWIGELVSRLGLGLVQLHGEESLDECRVMPVPVLKAVPLGAPQDVDQALRLPEPITPLLDVRDPIRRGGTGTTVDWTLAAMVASRRPAFLAGGLRPDNVEEAIGIVRPCGVDVSSGLETSPGIKDPTRVSAFFAAVRKATEGSVAGGR